MWLINVNSYELKSFLDLKKRPQYAILSHTWGEEEVSFQEIKTLDQARLKNGFRKIIYCCQQAKKDGYSWAWVDTCCIDKTSSAELSESINSMFAWYSESSICYAFLEDVNSTEDFVRPKATRPSCEWKPPRWFTRGWTLQELLAPSHIVFYSEDWRLLGSLSEHQHVIADLTGIEHGILDRRLSLDEVPVATRMSWASKRNTTRKEDEAYCLLGIFDVHMPLLYGEGDKAFQRLLKEILTKTEDQTILLWGSRGPTQDMEGFHFGYERPCFPESPHEYQSGALLRTVFSNPNPDMRVTTQERGIRIAARTEMLANSNSLRKWVSHFESSKTQPLWLMALNCFVELSRSNSSYATNGRVAILITPSMLSNRGTQTWTIHGHAYFLVSDDEVEGWPVSTLYLQNTNTDFNDFGGGLANWKTSSFGYGDRCPVEQVNTNAEHTLPGCDNVLFAWGTLLDQSSSLPWVLVTYGRGTGDLGAFCDAWLVPQLIKEKLMELESNQKMQPEHRVSVLCDARIEDLYTGGGSPVWRRRWRRNGPWAMAHCRINKELELTATILADLELELSIRSSSSLTRPSGVSKRPNDIWHYIELHALPVLYSNYDEYMEFCDYSSS
ncbi:heterokaryon incompatibility protein-domain-containing protein [Paramyrothecium foliicola]|nr:heterokaryon incompatibility protein-domain-containing protein [Paramyrothecium foliicola]